MNKSLVLAAVMASLFLSSCKTLEKFDEMVSRETTPTANTDKKPGFKEERLTQYKWLITYQGPSATTDAQAISLLNKHINEFGKAQCKGRFQTDQSTAKHVTEDEKPLYVEASAIMSCDK